ncbi:MAG: DNA-binding response regulator [Candidatus Omnitrophica bacterium CG11_big_fil_rev_8_21_14_0_20_45_26]|uniref:DNA-binding response regulator n=1 Tax=Candidatus Abzuiibacterium crystallinum TaxID=1974748 RepID=A0A2H0LMY1_9BACT|nr:MAG: DNA-binding response regulator [Candidatus Omnitrophica bacterium CG11_big_fil_rev_8_21_14_0_20_45_26]
MAKEKVLIVEDEKNIVELVKFNLEEAGFTPLVATKGDEGLEMARQKKIDMILLDLMLPGIGGLEICKILRSDPKTRHIPIIMLTARGAESDRVIGLELGADDYIAKPFSPRELIARMKAVLRRIHQKDEGETIKIGVLRMDMAKHVVTLKDKPVELSSKEYDLLKILLEVKGRVLSRDVLLDRVWGYDQSLNIETRTVDMHIGQLRKKLKTEAFRIVTVKNVGYRFDFDG